RVIELPPAVCRVEVVREMKTSYPCSFAARKMRSMLSTVRFSVTLSPTAAHAAPFSLRTSFWGSMKTTAVSFRLNCTMSSSFSRTRARSPPRLPWKARGTGRASGLQELQQIGVHLVLVGRTHAVRGALVHLERDPFDQFGRAHRGSPDRDDLIIVAMQDERRHIR